jgi:hypothetical protein
MSGQTRCLPGSQPGSRETYTSTRRAAPPRQSGQWGGNGDGGDCNRDGGGGGGVDGQGIACALQAQTHVSVARCARQRQELRRNMWAGVSGRTVTRGCALAVQKGPPSPAARPGPLHVRGRVVRFPAHTLTGCAPAVSLRRSRIDQSRVACARARTRELPNARAGDSLSCGEHEDIAALAGRVRIEAGGHLDHWRPSRQSIETAAHKRLRQR